MAAYTLPVTLACVMQQQLATEASFRLNANHIQNLEWDDDAWEVMMQQGRA